jgi:hypothetical protein
MRQLARLLRLAQLLARELVLGLGFVARGRRHEVLLVELLGAGELALRELHARLGGLDLALHRRARLGQIERRALGRRFQPDQHLALLHRVAAVYQDGLDQRLHRAAHVHGLVGLDQAVVLRRVRVGGEQAGG